MEVSEKMEIPHWIIHFDLVGGWATPLKNMLVKWEYMIPNRWKKHMFQNTNQLYYLYLSIEYIHFLWMIMMIIHWIIHWIIHL